SERGRLLLTFHPGKNGARGRSLTFIPGVRSAVLCGLSYASVNGGNGRDCTFGLLHVGQALCGSSYVPGWCSRLASHQRPPPSDDGALLTELQERIWKIGNY